jgi:hypothetical protein
MEIVGIGGGIGVVIAVNFYICLLISKYFFVGEPC